ncbi:VOC family protein [Fodinicurvata sediminis]|uniref:VOC family protein n=1 Tax=Fodinicurvata sediminis TaxID=1121832 RepID=UPI0003B587B2|nr:VOC family protein [Fodinicurvata sediminis]
MDTAVEGLDHALIGVQDLEAARAGWERLGFTLTPRGRHTGWGTANYCIMFPYDYLELLGIVDAQQFTNNLDRFLAERGEGLLSLAFASSDIEESARLLSEQDVDHGGPKDLSRGLELPEGTVEPAFRLLHPAPEASPAFPAFICQHLTPEMVWQPQWTSHENAATAVREVQVTCAHPGETAMAYAALLGGDNLEISDGRAVLTCGPCRILLQPLTDTVGVREGLSGLSLLSGDLKRTEACLRRNGVTCTLDDEGVHVPGEEATGVPLSFVSH